MPDRRDDPMRLWIGKWTPERPSRPLAAEKTDEKQPVTEADQASNLELAIVPR